MIYVRERVVGSRNIRQNIVQKSLNFLMHNKYIVTRVITILRVNYERPLKFLLEVKSYPSFRKLEELYIYKSCITNFAISA